MKPINYELRTMVVLHVEVPDNLTDCDNPKCNGFREMFEEDLNTRFEPPQLTGHRLKDGMILSRESVASYLCELDEEEDDFEVGEFLRVVYKNLPKCDEYLFH